MKIYQFIIVLFFPPFIVSQLETDQGSENRYEDDCGGQIFTQSETLPAINVNVQSFGDSLISYLLSNNTPVKQSKFRFRLLLTSSSQIIEIMELNSNTRAANVLSKGLKYYEKLWNPAVQNRKKICTYIYCDLDFTAAGKFEMEIFQDPSNKRTIPLSLSSSTESVDASRL
jgi:hypothetical protein